MKKLCALVILSASFGLGASAWGGDEDEMDETATAAAAATTIAARASTFPAIAGVRSSGARPIVTGTASAARSGARSDLGGVANTGAGASKSSSVAASGAKKKSSASTAATGKGKALVGVAAPSASRLGGKGGVTSSTASLARPARVMVDAAVGTGDGAAEDDEAAAAAADDGAAGDGAGGTARRGSTASSSSDGWHFFDDYTRPLEWGVRGDLLRDHRRDSLAQDATLYVHLHNYRLQERGADTTVLRYKSFSSRRTRLYYVVDLNAERLGRPEKALASGIAITKPDGTTMFYVFRSGIFGARTDYRVAIYRVIPPAPGRGGPAAQTDITGTPEGDLVSAVVTWFPVDYQNVMY